MRRSRHVATLLLGTALVVPLAACEEAPPAERLYSSHDACLAENTVEACADAERQALERHRSEAPRFANQEACEAQMGPGNCEGVPATTGTAAGTAAGATGGNWFMPAMMGFLLGRTLGGAGAMPVYVDRQGYTYAGGRPYGSLDRASAQNWSQGRWAPGYRSAGTPPRPGGIATAPRIDVRPPATGGVSRGTTNPGLGQPAAVQRGGFGSTGRSFGGGGS
jgi:uncharacterized protein YgiB involved in biofilm formation